MAELQELNGNGEADDWRDGEMMSGSGEGSCGGELLVHPAAVLSPAVSINTPGQRVESPANSQKGAVTDFFLGRGGGLIILV